VFWSDLSLDREVAFLSAQDLMTTYRVEKLASGEKRFTKTFADGFQNVAERGADGVFNSFDRT
jgi:hypothetical protein